MKRPYRFTHREVALYRKEKALAESKRVDVTNAILNNSKLRSSSITSLNPQMEVRVIKLNDRIRSKPIESTMKVINYWLEEGKFTAL
ncbi:MAG: hypothetical protein B7C24_17190 [Bacteroidetes bacterium 4572_77]|nr:MAG: hypothetical protein B7C24_17190 [Bacteroidetes bacterium 4572_77]